MGKEEVKVDKKREGVNEGMRTGMWKKEIGSRRRTKEDIGRGEKGRGRNRK